MADIPVAGTEVLPPFAFVVTFRSIFPFSVTEITPTCFSVPVERDGVGGLGVGWGFVS